MTNWYERFVLKIIDCGEIPEHIAIIMDGNRRYARKMHLEKVSDGHEIGAEKLKQLIQWLSVLHGIKTLTVYAFSLLNFKRNREEVESLMDLAVRTFGQMAEELGEFRRRNCAVRFIGRKELLDERVQEQMKRVEALGPEHPEFLLNICVAYTSHDEIERARDACFQDKVEPTWEEVFRRLELPRKPDLLIRTSGVQRMSNFLLMQCAETPIIVVEKLWPELNIWDLAKIMIRYQLRHALPMDM